MMTNRYAFVAAAIIATFLLVGCQTAQKSGSSTKEAPIAKAESPNDTRTVKGINGWEGETIYKMDDGSIWGQSVYNYHYHYAYHPQVLIYKSQSGACHIKVEGDDDEGVDVHRLK